MSDLRNEKSLGLGLGLENYGGLGALFSKGRTTDVARAPDFGE